MRTSRSPGGTRFLARFAGSAIGLALAATTAAAQTGVVAGTVTEASSGRGLSAVRIQIVGNENAAASTDANGHFIIRNAPTGAQTVRATQIGYRPESKAITVGADTTRVTFQLSQSAVELQQVVVTGTGGAVEKRQVGASIGEVDATKLQDQMVIPDVGRMLSSKVTGLRATTVGGGVGTGQDIRIRGTASFSLNQRPAIYIDGVRVDQRATEWFQDGACCSFGGGASTDRLGDLNPNDIERVEVLKGAAAATLYGSEATNGVIQIFTKRGHSSDVKTQFNMGVATGFDELRHNLPVTQFPRFTGPDGTRALDANETMIKKGPYGALDLSAQGGGGRTTYFASTQLSKETGSIQPNDQTKGSLRLNLTFAPTDKWTIDARSAYARDRINEIQAGNNWTALLGNALNGDPKTATKDRPYGEAWVPVKDIQTMKTQSDVDRWTGGLTLNNTIRPNITHRFTMGVDAVNDHKWRFFPYEGAFGPAGVTDGQANRGTRNYKTYTVDYLAQWQQKLPWDFESNLSVGGQGFWDIESLITAVGNTFPGPGVSVISAAAKTTAGEQYTKTVNLGFLAQDRFSFKDALFFTAGVRIDGNSAFGKDYGYQTYPKFDMSYDMTHSGFLPKVFSAARIRAAYGQAGKMPGPFDSFTSYAATPVFASDVGIVPLNPGNADLRPEKSTEKELGLEFGLFSDRLGFEGSLYNQVTDDAIVPKSNPPSAGFTQPRSVNIGTIKNNGWEAGLTYQAYTAAHYDWTIGLKGDGNKNKITSLGGVDLGDDRYRLGYPVGGVWDRKPTGFTVQTTGTDPTLGDCTKLTYGCPVTSRSDTTVYYGPGLPTSNFSLTNTFRVHSFTFYALVSMEHGAYFGNGDRSYRIRQGGADEFLKALTPDGQATFKSDSIRQYASILDYVDKRNNVRFREFSISWNMPISLSNRINTGPTSITLTGQNIMWWDKCNCVDPNMNWGGSESFIFNNGFLMQPAPRVWRIQFRTRF